MNDKDWNLCPYFLSTQATPREKRLLLPTPKALDFRLIVSQELEDDTGSLHVDRICTRKATSPVPWGENAQKGQDPQGIARFNFKQGEKDNKRRQTVKSFACQVIKQDKERKRTHKASSPSGHFRNLDVCFSFQCPRCSLYNTRVLALLSHKPSVLNRLLHEQINK